VSAIRALPQDLQRRAFYQCWTSKEAFLKAKGVGLSGELDEVEILLDPSTRPPAMAGGHYLGIPPENRGVGSGAPGLPGGLHGQGLVRVKGMLSEWSLRELNPCDGYVGAVALEGDESDLRRFQWAGPSNGTRHSHS
jgi:hypothetical protein